MAYVVVSVEDYLNQSFNAEGYKMQMMCLKNDVCDLQRFTLLGKIYVWSIVLEPMLFFAITRVDIFGVGINFGRLFQLLVLVGLGVRFLNNHGTIKVPNLFGPLYQLYSWYVLLAILAACYGLVSGAYEINHIYKLKTWSDFSRALSSSSVRPFFEYFIAIYYFLYFVILPRYFLNSVSGIEYFFKIFFAVFSISFVVGVIDLILLKISLVYGLGYDGMPRHIFDDHYPGFRFSGLAGEPRNAFVYLFLGLSIYILRGIWNSDMRPNVFVISLLLLAAMFTKSASGFLGLVFSGFLVIVYYLPKLPAKRVLPFTFILFLLVFAFIIAGLNSPRLVRYFDAGTGLYNDLDAGRKVAPVLQPAMNNVYPIWSRWVKLTELNIFPLIIGTGFGSSSVVNNNFMHTGGVLNPNSNLIRNIYDNGILGTYIFILAFIYPIRKICSSLKDYNKLILCMLLLLGTFFGQRSPGPFIFLGLTIVVMKIKQKTQDIKNGA